jgi:hypothetical protein
MGNLQLSRLCRLCQNVMLVLQGGARLVKYVQLIRLANSFSRACPPVFTRRAGMVPVLKASPVPHVASEYRDHRMQRGDHQPTGARNLRH